VCALAPFHAFGQDDEDDDQGTEFVYGINLNSNAGLIGGVIFRHSQPISDRMYQHFGVEIVNVKHPKEFPLPRAAAVRSFTANTTTCSPVRPQYGREIVLFRKGARRRGAHQRAGAAGPSIGIIKPYFVELAVSNTQTIIVQYDPTKCTARTASWAAPACCASTAPNWRRACTPSWALRSCSATSAAA
jgi:hypothetical protein